MIDPASTPIQPLSKVPVGGLGLLSFATEPASDSLMAQSVPRGAEWQPFQSLLFRMAVGSGSVVCDVGAQLGWYSVVASRLGASVVAIEPDPTDVALLQENLRLNDCLDVRVVHAALADHGSLTPELSDVFANTRVDVLRLAANGAEATVLSGAGHALEGLRAAFVQFSARELQSAGSSVAHFVEQLQVLHLDMFEIDSSARVIRPTSAETLRERSQAGIYSAAGGCPLHLLLLRADQVADFAHLAADYPPGKPLADELDPEERRRVELTVSCDDCAQIPKVAGAGTVQRFRDQDVQVMHNGVRVVAGCYYGAWTTEIIGRLHGHHEPQEELVFHEIVSRVARDASGTSDHLIVELGAFWSYYALWFMEAVPRGRAVLVEPDPRHLDVAAVNLLLNDREAIILQAAVGPSSAAADFECEDGLVVQVEGMTLDQIVAAAGAERADVVLSDIQGAETSLLELSIATIAQRTRFLVLSTHHESISGRADTHQRCLELLQQCGGHIIAEHTIDESFSGDGLIAVSFDPKDRDMHVNLSAARHGTSLFRERPLQEVRDYEASLREHVANLEASLAAAVEYSNSLEHNYAALQLSFLEAERYALDLRQHLDAVTQ